MYMVHGGGGGMNYVTMFHMNSAVLQCIQISTNSSCLCILLLKDYTTHLLSCGTLQFLFCALTGYQVKRIGRFASECYQAFCIWW